MKTKLLNQIRPSKYLIVLSFLFLAMACKDGKKTEPVRSGSTARTDLCELLNEELIRTTFNLSEDIVLEKSDNETICMYDWVTKDDKTVAYSLSLNFARGEQRSDASAQAVWEGQNNGIYADKDMREVTEVGDKATWSNLGGGQLRVLNDGYIFYVSLMTFMDDQAISAQEKIEKSKIIAEGVIKQL